MPVSCNQSPILLHEHSLICPMGGDKIVPIEYMVQDKLYLLSKIMTVERFNGIKQSVLKASEALLKRLALIWVFQS